MIARAEVGPDTPHVEIGRALAAAMPTGPTVVVIDDAHLLDGVTLRALGVALDLLEDRAGADPRGLPLRSERRDTGTRRAPPASERRRDRAPPALRTTASRRWPLRSIVSLDPDELDEVMHRSGGNPFFAEELLRSPDTDVSWTVTDAVCEHVRAVGDAAARVANVLAVATCRWPQHRAHRSRTWLWTARPPPRRDRRRRPRPTSSFRHALIGEALRRQLSAPDRKELLARLAERLADEPTPPAARSLITGSTREIARKQPTGPPSQPNRPRLSGATRPRATCTRSRSSTLPLTRSSAPSCSSGPPSRRCGRDRSPPSR